MTNAVSASSGLRFLDATRLQAPLVEPLDVRTLAGISIGTFDGVVVDPAERRVRYLVVDRGSLIPERCLIPLPSTSVDTEHHTLSLDVDAADSPHWQQFDPITFPRFSDDDMVTAMFAPRD